MGQQSVTPIEPDVLRLGADALDVRALVSAFLTSDLGILATLSTLQCPGSCAAVCGTP